MFDTFEKNNEMDSITIFLKHTHSGLRWMVLAILLYAIVNALVNLKKGDFSAKDKLVNILTLSFVHLQVVIGLILYFTEGRFKGFSNMSDATSRLYALEHPLTMILGAILITVGHVKVKKATNSKRKYRLTALYFGLGLLLILSRIPW
jgi:hypothetical protein